MARKSNWFPAPDINHLIMNLVNRIICKKRAHEMSSEITQQSNTLKSKPPVSTGGFDLSFFTIVY